MRHRRHPDKQQPLAQGRAAFALHNPVWRRKRRRRVGQWLRQRAEQRGEGRGHAARVPPHRFCNPRWQQAPPGPAKMRQNAIAQGQNEPRFPGGHPVALAVGQPYPGRSRREVPGTQTANSQQGGDGNLPVRIGKGTGQQRKQRPGCLCLPQGQKPQKLQLFRPPAGYGKQRGTRVRIKGGKAAARNFGQRPLRGHHDHRVRPRKMPGKPGHKGRITQRRRDLQP